MSSRKKVVLLGATGSIGDSTLQVLRKHPDKLELLGASAHRQEEKLLSIVNEFEAPHAHLGSQPETPKASHLLLASTRPIQTSMLSPPIRMPMWWWLRLLAQLD